MKVFNRDTKIFMVSVVLNLLVLFLIPKMKYEKSKEYKLKVGLVSLENKNTRMEKREETNLKKTVAKKEIKTGQDIKKEVPKKTVSLDDLAKNISKRKVEIMTVDKTDLRETSNELKDELLAKKNIKDAKKNIEPSEDAEIDTKSSDKAFEENTDIKEKDIKIDSKNSEEVGFKSMVDKEGVEGLPSGYKLGVEDGDVVAKWDTNNLEPEYPESAQLRGMQGKVLLKMEIDENGRVSSVFIERGSGVPEINEAIEQIARTWRIYLTKNGLNIKGNVTLEYSFKLKGSID